MLSFEQLEARRVLAPVIDVGDHFLLPNTPGQQIQIYVTGGDEVQGLNFNVQVEDGGPELADYGGTIDGPALTTIDVESGTIFEGNTLGATNPEPPFDIPQWEGRYITTEIGTVIADGLLATITVDTTGFTEGSFSLILGDENLNGPTDFAGIPITITEGQLIINSVPVANPDAFTTPEDTPLTGSVLDNDTDVDGDNLTAETVSGPSHGTLALNPDGTFVYTPDQDFNGVDSFQYTATDGVWTSDPTTVTITVTPVTDILARNIVYNDSYWDGDDPLVTSDELSAIAPDKVPLFQGQTATYANVSNYEHGINEVLIIVDDLPGTVTAADFELTVGNTSDFQSWTVAPVATVVVQADVGDNGQDLVHLVWDNGSIKGEWLRVAMLPNANTGLSQEDSFFYGSAPGDVGDSDTDFVVDASDVIAVRGNPHIFINPAAIDDVWDVNRDSFVNATDMLLARKNSTSFPTALQVITPDVVPVQGPIALYSFETESQVKSNDQDFARERTCVPLTEVPRLIEKIWEHIESHHQRPLDVDEFDLEFHHHHEYGPWPLEEILDDLL
jgi:VCBS repeat-containing protein